MIRAGSSWCDLAINDGAVEFVHLRGTTVVCEDAQTGTMRWEKDAGQPLLYLRASASNGRVCAIGQGQQDGQAWVVIEGRYVGSIGTTHGVFPVLLYGLMVGGWRCYVQNGPNSFVVCVLDVDGRVVNREQYYMPPTSQGFLYVGDNSAPVTQDAGRHAVTGLALASPSRVLDVWAGQSTTVASIALFDGETGAVTSIGTPGGQPPHIVESGGTYYVCSYVDGGAWLSTHRRPFGAPAPPPVEPPPVTPPEERPVQLESKHSDLIEAFAERFGMPGFSKEEGQAWVGKLASTFKARFPGEGWGTKRASMGRPLSNESIARPGNGRLWSYDLIIGAGAPGQRLESHAHAEDITDQVFVEVESRDWLGGSTPTNPGTPNPPTTPPATKPLPIAAMMPNWDVEVHMLTRFHAGIYPRDRVPEVTETGITGSGTVSRGALAFFIPAQLAVTVAWVTAHGGRAPDGMEWWPLADQIADEAIAAYHRAVPTP